MQRKAIRLLALLLATFSLPFLLFGCAGMEAGQKETVGTIIGSIVGGWAGSEVGKGRGRAAATVAGAVAGGYLGSRIGAYLDEVDRRKQEQATLAALQSAQSKPREIWSNPETGVRGEVTAGPVTYESRRVAESKAPTISLLNVDYLALKSANVRDAPTIDASVVASLRAGETFRAVGKVEGANWIMAAREGRTIGYVHSSLVKSAVAVAPKPKVDVSPVVQEPAEAQEKVVAVKCRSIIRTVTLADGETLEEDAQYCQEPDGDWVAQA